MLRAYSGHDAHDRWLAPDVETLRSPESPEAVAQPRATTPSRIAVLPLRRVATIEERGPHRIESHEPVVDHRLALQLPRVAGQAHSHEDLTPQQQVP